MNFSQLRMGGTQPARDLYNVAIAPPRPGAFLAPFTLSLAFERLPNARYGGDVVLSAWLAPTPGGRALAGANEINPRRSSGRRPSRSFGRRHFFFSFFFDSTRAKPAAHHPRFHPTA